MKNIVQIISFYFIYAIAIRFLLYGGTAPEHIETRQIDLHTLKANSFRCDGYHYHDQVTVIEIGNVALDAVFVDNMLVSDGTDVMRVYGNFAMPKVGDEIMLEAQFRQIWDNSIIQNWVGLNAIQVNGMPFGNRTSPLR